MTVIQFPERLPVAGLDAPHEMLIAHPLNVARVLGDGRERARPETPALSDRRRHRRSGLGASE